ncbi:unnamed protein product [Clonostachys chloroleuca]|uniref:Uncharacterized protein n=1 Tax=Clonostachys chloroleuca TaxID=1926264 RepID=A0AA35Q1N8_9HYPO|nr:unnamed protein product [Clonostachys chloroleuca]
MPAKTTKSVGRQEERRKAARDTGIVETNATRCLEDAEPSSDFRAKASQILVKAVDSSAALQAVKTSQAGKRFESESTAKPFQYLH